MAIIGLMISLPTTLLLDLDDTILDSYSADRDQAWLEVCHEFAGHLGAVTPEELLTAILDSRVRFGVIRSVHVKAALTSGRPEGTSCTEPSPVSTFQPPL